MSLNAKGREMLDSFSGTPPIETDHFVIHYGQRAPAAGRGRKHWGVKGYDLVDHYRRSLEVSYSALSGRFGRRPPVTGAGGRTHVYVFDIPSLGLGSDFPFTSVDADGIPYIVLPCRTSEPRLESEILFAESAAAHEVVHVFNFRERDPLKVSSAPWAWFDEATAVFIEECVLPGNPDYLRFGMNWSDCPDVPIDDRLCQFESFMFVRYLAGRFGLDFLNKVWCESAQAETPLDALSRLVPLENEGVAFASAEVEDLFASGYCLDSYFLADPGSAAFAPELHARYGDRAIEETFDVAPGDTFTRDETLDHLSCRYYRLKTREQVNNLEVSCLSDSRVLKMEVAHAGAEGRRGRVTRVARNAPVRVDPPAPASNEHLVLVVCNCGTRRAQRSPGIPHDDHQGYSVHIRAW